MPPTRSLFLVLPQPVAHALYTLAALERRHPRDQALLLLVKALEQACGPSVAPIAGSRPTATDTTLPPASVKAVGQTSWGADAPDGR
jgi:hypothetical protein